MKKANYMIVSFSFVDKADGQTYWQVNIKTEDNVQTNYFNTETKAQEFIEEVDKESI
jgi:hypothetical protein